MEQDVEKEFSVVYTPQVHLYRLPRCLNLDLYLVRHRRPLSLEDRCTIHLFHHAVQSHFHHIV